MNRLNSEWTLVCLLVLLFGAVEVALGVPNDDCQDAQATGEDRRIAFSTMGATYDGPGGASACNLGPNVWFCYTASCTDDVTVTIYGAHYDTVLAIYNGCDCDLTSSDRIGCNDDYGDSWLSQVTFAAVAGNQYLIEVGGYQDYTGSGYLSISCDGQPVPQPTKDNCENAQAIGDVSDMPFDTRDATFDGPGLCMTGVNIWYIYTASCTGNATVSLLGSSYDTMLAVYKGDDCDMTTGDMIACNDDARGGYQSEITFAATAGEKYLIEIGGYGSAKGQGILNIRCESDAFEGVTDLGDAPDSTNNYDRNMDAYPKPGAIKANYPTVYNDGSGAGPFGPVHLNNKLVAHLGKSITLETEADTGADEDGANNIRPSSGSSNNDKGDDGVVFPLNLPHCQWATFDYIIGVIDPSVDLWINVWFDWNRDGDWDDTFDCTQGIVTEWAIRNQFLFNLAIGSNQITTPAFLSWHPKSAREEIWMRITLSEKPWKGGSNPDVKGNAGSGPEEKYLYGETEDYYFSPDVSFSICQDFNGDGVINTDDLVDFTTVWQENCPD